MKWIETKTGNLINLENVYRIFLDGNEVHFRFTSSACIYEEFDTEKDAEARLEELKKKLL
jgi:metal-sulfur cluster biosynthetic enzyme